MENYIDFRKDIILENERVQLRPMMESDLSWMLSFAENEPELWKYSLISGAGKQQMHAYVERALQNRLEQKEYPFIVIEKKNKVFAGSTRFYDIQPVNKSLQLGFTWYGKSFQGTGINKDCKYLLLQYAFEIIKMERVEFRADFENKRSIAAMKGIGCIEEGVLRKNVPKPNGERRDSIVLSILKPEWEGRVKQLLLSKMSK